MTACEFQERARTLGMAMFDFKFLSPVATAIAERVNRASRATETVAPQVVAPIPVPTETVIPDDMPGPIMERTRPLSPEMELLVKRLEWAQDVDRRSRDARDRQSWPWRRGADL